MAAFSPATMIKMQQQNTNSPPLYALCLLGYLFIALPLFDMSTGYLVLGGHLEAASIGSPSQAGRLIAMAALTFSLRRAQQWIALSIVLTYGVIVEATSAIQHSDPGIFMYGVVVIYKLAYPLAVLFFFQDFLVNKSRVQTLNRFFTASMLIIAANLYCAAFLGIGYTTYENGAGVKGFFASGNTIGLYLGFGSLYLAASKRYCLAEISNFTLWFLTFGTLLVGTKTAFIFAAITTIVLILNVRNRALMAPMLSLFGIGVLALAWQSILAAFDVVLWRLGRAESLVGFLGSGRINYVNNAFSSFMEQDVGFFRFFFGSGGHISFRDYGTKMSFDTLETDFFDLFFMYGSIACLAYIILLSVTARRLRSRAQLLLAFLLLAGHSILMGHTLFSGLMSVCLSMCGAISTYQHKLSAKYA